VSPSSETTYLTPEARARVDIDRMLEAAGWAVQGASAVNLSASHGVAVREFVMKKPHGRADYLLFLDGRAVGVIEAKNHPKVVQERLATAASRSPSTPTPT
jgi:type I restriction enzyme, R subunit